jgi:hypothetical protein
VVSLIRAGFVPLVLLGVPTADLASALRGADTIALQVQVSDDRGAALPCRIHLFDAQGMPHRPADLPFWHDHFVCPGRATLRVVPGKYQYTVERGPEYERLSGQLDISPTSAADGAQLQLMLRRIADLRRQGWFAGDLHVHRPLDEIELLMQAEDLAFAPVITWWNDRNLWDTKALPTERTRTFDSGRTYDILAGEDEREGGALLYFGLERPLSIAGSEREFPSPMEFVQQAHRQQPNVWIDIEKPFWWDVPVWLASGQMKSIGIANNHMCRSQMYENEAWGRPRDVRRWPNPRGNGYWTQEIYYHALNCGVRIPPSAGSASGVLPNPVGYNRVYALLGNDATGTSGDTRSNTAGTGSRPVDFDRDAWFRSLAAGRCFVTNGPLLLVTANGHLPGARLIRETGQAITVNIEATLTSRDRVSQLEVIQNGQVVHRIDCDDSLVQQRSVAIAIEGPGWFLVRAIAQVDNTFRFASTGPWFVEIRSAEERISRASVQFFLDWIDQRIERITRAVRDEARRDQILAWHHQARAFWNDRLAHANAP